MPDNRRHPRIPMKAKVKLTHPELGEFLATTRDISDGGIFILNEGDELPPVGTVVQGQVQGLAGEAPLLKMEVVRAMPEGVGLRFILD